MPAATADNTFSFGQTYVRPGTSILASASHWTVSQISRNGIGSAAPFTPIIRAVAGLFGPSTLRDAGRTIMTQAKFSRRALLAGAGALAAGLAAPGLLRAQSYATRPVRLFVGTPGAGSNDLVARLIAPVFEAELGQPVVVENRPGGATTMAVGLVGQAEPDGHVLLVSSAAAISTHVTSVEKPPNLLGDLDHVGMICDGAFIYAVHKDVPATTTDEFVALLKAEPGSVRYGATGAGGGIHLSGALFQQQTGTEMTVVHYANAGMRLNELLANQTQLGIAGAAVLAQQINAGTLRPLFVADRDRGRHQRSGRPQQLVRAAWPEGPGPRDRRDAERPRRQGPRRSASQGRVGCSRLLPRRWKPGSPGRADGEGRRAH
jgi:tripartite-type tricarboxylate transporter receptor subunit TctC